MCKFNSEITSTWRQVGSGCVAHALLPLCLCLHGIFHGQGLNCHSHGEVMKSSWTLLPLAAALCFPGWSCWTVQDVHCDTAKRTAPRHERYHSFLRRFVFPRICKERNCRAKGAVSVAMEVCVVICQLHMETGWKNIQWHIGTSHHFSFPAAKNSTIQAALCALTKDERRFFALGGGTQGSGINSTL